MGDNSIFPILDRNTLILDKKRATSKPRDDMSEEKIVDKILEEVDSPMFTNYVNKMIEHFTPLDAGQKLSIIQSPPVREYARQVGVKDRLESAIDRYI